jgi:hypothetical protein
MMENFSHILQRLPIETCASSSSDHFGGTSPFKVQINFDIPIFEGQIYGDALEKWLNLLEGYFSIQFFFDREKITFALLNTLPMSNIGGKLTGRKFPQRNLEYMGSIPLGIVLWMGALHRYIQTKIDFLNISPLGASYRYVVKIKKNL